MPDDIARLKIRIESLEAEKAADRLQVLEDKGRKAELGVAKLSKTSFSTKRVLTALGGAGAAAGAALAGGAILATREWLRYDKAIKEVQSITGQTTAEFKAMRKEVLGVARDLGVDATQAAQGLYQALSAGVPQGQQAIDFLRVASKTAIAGVTDVDTAVDGLTNVLNAFKIPVEEAEVVADKLFQTVKDGKTNFEELASSIAIGAVPASALGVSLDELLAQIVGITKQGESTSKAFTEVRAIMTALVKPTDEMAALFERLNVESGRALIQQEGFAGALQKVRDGFNGNDAALAKALSSVEAYNGLLAVTGDNLTEVEKAQDSLATSSGAMAGAYRTNSQTLENALNSLKASAIGLIEQMEASLGIIAAFTEALQGAALAIADISGTSISEATDLAIESTGAQGVATMEARLRDLHMLRTQLNQLNMEGEHLVPTTGRLSQFGTDQRSGLDLVREFQGGFGDVTGIAGTVDILAKVDQEIGQINSKLEKVPKNTKAIAEAAKEINTLAAQRDSGAITAEEFETRRLARMKELQGVQSEIKKIKEEETKAAEAAEKAEADKLRTAQEAVEAAKEEDKFLTKAADQALSLATTEQDRLNIKLQAIEAAREAGRIDEETFQKAKARLAEQMAAASGGGGVGGGGGGGGGAGGGGGIIGRFDPGNTRLGPATTPEEDFERAMEDLQFQFLEQRDLILSETQITEDARTALVLQLTEERNRQVAQIEKDRVAFQRENNLQSLSIFEDTLGQFNQVFADAGQEGSAVAKALFVAQKAAAIAGILVNTEAQAALAGAQTGIFGLPLQFLIRAQGAASAGIVAGTTIAGLFEHGGMVPAGQFGIVGEAGPELVRGPMAVTSAASTRDAASRANGGGGESPTVNVEVINNAPGVEVETRRSEDQKSLQLVVRQATQEVANQINRGEGPVPRAMESTYQTLNRG